MCSEGYSKYLVCHYIHPSVRLSVYYHVFCHYAQQGGQKAIPTRVSHWLDFKNGDLRTSTAFKSFGIKTKWTSFTCYPVVAVTKLHLPYSKHSTLGITFTHWFSVQSVHFAQAHPSMCGIELTQSSITNVWTTACHKSMQPKYVVSMNIISIM